MVHLYGRLADGGTFLVRDDRQRPHFYIRAADAERAQRLGALEARGRRSARSTARPSCWSRRRRPGTCLRCAIGCTSAGIDTFEADVRFAMRYLIERGIKGGCEIEGEAVPATLRSAST